MTPLDRGRTLRLSWTPPPGDWDEYSILLKNGSEVLVNLTVGNLSRNVDISDPHLGLIPGRVYKAEVSVHSGDLSHTAHCQGRLRESISAGPEPEPGSEICCSVMSNPPLPSAAPGSVQLLSVCHSDDSALSVQWTRPAGQWDGFTVLLTQLDPPGLVSQRILPWESRECSFNLLPSGRRFTVTVVTESGNLSSSASVAAWTGTSVGATGTELAPHHDRVPLSPQLLLRSAGCRFPTSEPQTACRFSGTEPPETWTRIRFCWFMTAASSRTRAWRPAPAASASAP